LGSFARCLLAAISGHHHGGIVCLILLEINNPNAPKILRAPRPPFCRTSRSRNPEKPEYCIKLYQKRRAMYDKAIRAQRKAQEQA
jgi:hypothetical protein